MSYDEHYIWAKDELRKTESKKREIILGLAIRLEESGMLVESVCAEISNNLSRDGYVTDRYVREVLENTKYKRKYQNKFTEDIGTSSELEQTEEQEANHSGEIAVSNTGEQFKSNSNPGADQKFMPLSDFIGMERAINDRDNTIKELRAKNEDLEKNVNLIAGMHETEANTNDIEKLKEELEGANMEIEFLKGKMGAEKIIALKGKKAENTKGQYYWGRTGIKLLKSKIEVLERNGIRTVEIFLITIG